MLIDNTATWREDQERRTALKEEEVMELVKVHGHAPVAFKSISGGWRVSECVKCHCEVRVAGSSATGTMLERDCDEGEAYRARRHARLAKGMA